MILNWSRLLGMAIMVFAFLASPRADAVTVAMGSFGGLMQQPTSGYYHAIYGAQITTSSKSFGDLLTRTHYFERPEFDRNGFAEKDYGYGFAMGTRVTKGKTHGLFAYAGIEQIEGYIRSDSQIRSYELLGLGFDFEYIFKFSLIDIGFSHHSFIGVSNQEQLNARVAWPYSFFKVHLNWWI